MSRTLPVAALLAHALSRPVAATDVLLVERFGADEGLTGTARRVVLRAHVGGIRELIVKTPPDRTLRDEVACYRDVLPGLDVRTPRCLFAGEAPDGSALLVLERVTGRRGDPLRAGEPDDVAAVLGALAPLWRRPPASTSLPAWRVDADGRGRLFARNWAQARQPLRTVLPGDAWALADRLGPRLASIATTVGAAPQSVLHADLHLGNVIFTGAGPVVLDWGSACVGPPAVDVVPLIAMSLAAADHDRHCADMVARAGLNPADAEIGPHRLLLLLAEVVGWYVHARSDAERQVAHAAAGDGRLAAALRYWDATGVVARAGP